MITPIYAALLALVFITLSARTIILRRKLQIAVGIGKNEQMLRAMRVHANFAEYVPFALLLAFMIEYQGLSAFVVHAMCLLLLIGRLIHAYGVSQVNEDFRLRVVGMVLTFCSIGFSALIALWVNIF